MKPVLSKSIGWILLACFLFIDAILDIIRGAEGNPLWKRVFDIFGIKSAPLMVPFILLLFYFVVKGGGWILKKTDKTPMSEELVLSGLVLIYGIFIGWVIAVDFLGFKLITNFRLMVVPLTVVGLGYSLWAQNKLKKLNRRIE